MATLEQKHDLLIKLGALFGPLQHLAANHAAYDDQERAQTLARFCAEFGTLIQEFSIFAHSKPGHVYMIENQNFHEAVGILWNRLRRIPISLAQTPRLPSGPGSAAGKPIGIPAYEAEACPVATALLGTSDPR